MLDVLTEPAPLTPAAERIAAAADDLFYRCGIRATGVDTIAEVAGTTKKTLYDRFGSKDALVALYLVRRARRWQAFLGSVLDRVPAGSDRVLAVFDAIDDWSRGTSRGCAFVNAYAEIGAADHPGIAVIRAEKTWMRACFVDLVTQAGIRDAERVAGTIQLLYEGALITAFVGGDPAAARRARDAVEELLSVEAPPQ